MLLKYAHENAELKTQKELPTYFLTKRFPSLLIGIDCENGNLNYNYADEIQKAMREHDVELVEKVCIFPGYIYIYLLKSFFASSNWQSLKMNSSPGRFFKT